MNKWNSIQDLKRPHSGANVWIVKEDGFSQRVVVGYYDHYPQKWFEIDVDQKKYQVINFKEIDPKHITHWMPYFTPEPPPHSNSRN